MLPYLSLLYGIDTATFTCYIAYRENTASDVSLCLSLWLSETCRICCFSEVCQEVKTQLNSQHSTTTSSSGGDSSKLIALEENIDNMTTLFLYTECLSFTDISDFSRVF